jgi:hypothetical protein
MSCPIGCNDCCTSVPFTPEQRQTVLDSGQPADKFVRVSGDWYSEGFAWYPQIRLTLEDKDRYKTARDLGYSHRQILMIGLDNCTGTPPDAHEGRLFRCAFKGDEGCEIYDLRPEVCRNYTCSKCGSVYDG